MASQPPLPNANLPSAVPDAMDQILFRFFQAELPRSWPMPPLVETQPSTLVAERAASAERASGATSRWALMASVALLMGVCWYAGSGTTIPGAAPIAKQKADENRAKAGDGVILEEMSKHKALSESDRLLP